MDGIPNLPWTPLRALPMLVVFSTPAARWRVSANLAAVNFNASAAEQPGPGASGALGAAQLGAERYGQLRFEEAAASLRRAFVQEDGKSNRVRGTLRSQVALQLADSLRILGRSHEAATLLDAGVLDAQLLGGPASEKKRAEVDVMRIRGLVFEELGRFSEAAVVYQKVAKAHRDADDLVVLGRLLEKLDFRDDAEQIYNWIKQKLGGVPATPEYGLASIAYLNRKKASKGKAHSEQKKQSGLIIDKSSTEGSCRADGASCKTQDHQKARPVSDVTAFAMCTYSHLRFNGVCANGFDFAEASVQGLRNESRGSRTPAKDPKLLRDIPPCRDALPAIPVQGERAFHIAKHLRNADWTRPLVLTSLPQPPVHPRSALVAAEGPLRSVEWVHPLCSSHAEGESIFCEDSGKVKYGHFLSKKCRLSWQGFADALLGNASVTVIDLDPPQKSAEGSTSSRTRTMRLGDVRARMVATRTPRMQLRLTLGEHASAYTLAGNLTARLPPPFSPILFYRETAYKDSAFFIASPGTRTPLHKDRRAALVWQLAGRKRFLLSNQLFWRRGVSDEDQIRVHKHGRANWQPRQEDWEDWSLQECELFEDEALHLPLGQFHDTYVPVDDQVSISLSLRVYRDDALKASLEDD